MKVCSLWVKQPRYLTKCTVRNCWRTAEQHLIQLMALEQQEGPQQKMGLSGIRHSNQFLGFCCLLKWEYFLFSAAFSIFFSLWAVQFNFCPFQIGMVLKVLVFKGQCHHLTIFFISVLCGLLYTVSKPRSVKHTRNPESSSSYLYLFFWGGGGGGVFRSAFAKKLANFVLN